MNDSDSESFLATIPDEWIGHVDPPETPFTTKFSGRCRVRKNLTGSDLIVECDDRVYIVDMDSARFLFMGGLPPGKLIPVEDYRASADMPAMVGEVIRAYYQARNN